MIYTRKTIYRTLSVLFLSGMMLSCNVEKKEEGEMPDLDVDVEADYEEGELPEYDVNWADVNIGTTTKTVEVPKVVVVTEEEQVEVPSIDIDMPDAGEKSERTLMVETEVMENEHDLEIKEIWATGKTLYVVAELEELENSIGDQKLRVSDQVSINAPDLDVRYYIVGDKPAREFNNRNTYVNSMSDLESRVGEHKVIYTR